MDISIVHIGPQAAQALPALPDGLPDGGFLWVALAPAVLQAQEGTLQDWLARVAGSPLLKAWALA